MIYLDYAADSPAHEEVLKVFVEANQRYFANPNSLHALGREAKEKIDKATDNIAAMLGVKAQEIIYTSGATESNNLAIQGICMQHSKKGKHIITSYLEHSSVTGPISYLQSQGFEVDFVKITSNGQIDIQHLKSLIREDTILVSIAYVDSELGVVQNIREISEVLKNYKNCYFHVDATQAIGKIEVECTYIDLMTCTAHKIGGLHGIGLLIKKEPIYLRPIIQGGISTTEFRSGTPTTALILSLEKALKLSLHPSLEMQNKMQSFNTQLRTFFSTYDKVQINSTDKSVPHIINISLKSIKAQVMSERLQEKGIFISTKSACTVPNTPSRPVLALTNERKRALSTLRISMSRHTTEEEIQHFMKAFDTCYSE